MLKLVQLPPYRIDVYDVLAKSAVLGNDPRSAHRQLLTWSKAKGSSAWARPRHGPVGGHDDRGGHRGHHPQVAGGVGKPDVSVQLARTAGTQPITGQYLIARTAPSICGKYGLFARGGQDRDGIFEPTCKNTCRSISTRPKRRST